MRILSVLFTLFFMAMSAVAGKYNPTVDIGDKLDVWKELESTSGKPHSWEGFPDSTEVVVVVFTCNSCPYAVDYEDRVRKLAEKYAQDNRVAVVAINANSGEEESLESMKTRIETTKWNMPYLKDESQTLGKLWGAMRTPEFFVLNADQRLIYTGAMDDAPNADDAKTNYVDAAINAALNGKTPEVTETVAIGCNIRYVRRRGSR